MKACRLGVAFGQQSFLYSFPSGHPMNSSRLSAFAEFVESEGASGMFTVVVPVSADGKELVAFHSRDYVDRVREASEKGNGWLGSEDTPAFQGVYEASLFSVGSTLRGLDLIMRGEFDHFFNPIGGLHHAAPDEARGFCVFNDAGIALSKALGEHKLRRVAYVDIDAHHGDGVYYEFEPDPRVIVGDIHEHGRFLYPGTGDEAETGKGFAAGTKLNIGLRPGAGDVEFYGAFDRVEDFVRRSEPDMIFFQCGADGLAGDPITDLRYTPAAHAYAARKMHRLAHELCQGRILAMGGGGYSSENVALAWEAVVTELSGSTGGEGQRQGARRERR